MASFCKVSVMAFVLLASGAFLSSPALAFEANEQDFSLASEPSSSSDQDIIPPALRIICFNASRSWMGDKCHTAITNAVISRPEFSGNATLFRTRSDETWTTCSQLVEAISPGPSA
ncbi:hypothetical protein CK203_103063 [Vitis vinifera]|uniref:Pectinesterase inhibitor domain-containing protein n=1 Tax=Vitis vinifera TaxID=29760 RepID=A0A438DUX6_VITVI|nr:hypothetical protein CK203_103063 [Vitis vinifera]